MPSKFSRFSEALMEAAWLAAVILVPVFFNVYSSRIFEPDKITLLRTLALLSLGAWLVKLIDEGRVRWDQIEAEKPAWKTIFSVPMIAPVLGLAVIYLLATAFSITPRISFWGSYQRLQGTYTTLSYLIIFAAMVGNLRRRTQVQRLITTMILSSLPVSLYGVLQRYEIDPIPWGGPVNQRIAANMGNSIFVAAYLIMVSPLTVMRVVESFGAILKEQVGLSAHVARSTIYVFIGALQVIAIYFSGSRGPWLGLMAGWFFLFVLLSLYWQRRALLLGVIAVALASGVFLIVLNIPQGPLEGLRNRPELNRLGQILDTESRTGRVRTLIWQGAVNLYLPHEPLQFPNGSTDALNALRPFIGYGPESMYVAYNPFYPPELTQVEKRNASPDRSHNETWDALAITGALGLVVYLIVFAAIFYFGLRWLGMITSARQRTVFLLFFIGGGVLGALILVALQGPGYFGVGLPFGIIIGQIAYLTLLALFGKAERAINISGERALILIALLSAIVAHFVEIHFGIAIAATRSYFWVYTALLLLVGYILPRHGEYSAAAALAGRGGPAESENEKPTQAEKETSPGGKRKKGRRPEPKASLGRLPSLAGWTDGLVIAILLSTLGYNYVSNLARSTSALEVVWSSLTRLQNKDSVQAFGILALVVTTWLASALVFSAENNQAKTPQIWLRMFGVTILISGAIGGLYWLIQAGNLAAIARITPRNQEDVLTQIAGFGNLLSAFYLFLGMLLALLALALRDVSPSRLFHNSGITPLLAPVIALAVLGIAYTTNLRVVQADITFKMADPFARETQWPVSILVYQRAIQQAPMEDYYYLFLSRAYLEYAKTLQAPEERNTLMTQAEKDLLKAQQLNPLNTDHTANLARLSSWWSSTTSDQARRKALAKQSDDYYAKALTLSPNNAVLYAERAVVQLNFLDEDQAALETLRTALQVDPLYDRTHAILGDYSVQQARALPEGAEQISLLEEAARQYQEALANLPNSSDARPARYTYSLALASVYLDLEQIPQAIDTYQQSIASASGQDVWRVEQTIAQLYLQIQDKPNALVHAQRALDLAPESEKARLETLIKQIQAATP